jgi:hypothetical protein
MDKMVDCFSRSVPCGPSTMSRTAQPTLPTGTTPPVSRRPVLAPVPLPTPALVPAPSTAFDQVTSQLYPALAILAESKRRCPCDRPCKLLLKTTALVLEMGDPIRAGTRNNVHPESLYHKRRSQHWNARAAQCAA